MQTEEQMHIEFLKERAQSIGLTFDQYMLFLIFETLEHAPVLNPDQTPFTTPWEEEYEDQERGDADQQPEIGGL